MRIMQYNEDGHLIGESHPKAKIPDSVVDEMRDLREQEEDEARALGLIGEEEELPQQLRKWTYKALAKKFKLSMWTIRDIVNYRTRSHTVARTRIIYDLVPSQNIT